MLGKQLASDCQTKDLKGFNAIVTGDSRGIGEACVYALAKEGANVAIAVNKSLKEAESVVAKACEMGIDACAIQCDVAKPNDVKKMVLYLASPKSKFVTGADWIIDGGYTSP